MLESEYKNRNIILVILAVFLLIFNTLLISRLRISNISKNTESSLVLGAKSDTLMDASSTNDLKTNLPSADKAFLTAYIDDTQFFVPMDELISEGQINGRVVFDYSPIHLSSSKGTNFSNGELICRENRYNFNFDKDVIQNKVEDSINYGTSLYVKTSELLSKNDLSLYNACNKYYEIKENLPYELEMFLEHMDLELDDIFKINIEDDHLNFTIRDITSLEKDLKDYRGFVSQSFLPSKYERRNNDVFLFTTYRDGRILNVEKTYMLFDAWNGQHDYTFMAYDTFENPEFSNLTLYDFSNVIAVGKTRLSLLVDGHRNPGISNAENGLYEINKTIIEPNQEFSYIDEIGAINSYTESGYHIGYGTCNSTTTLFRAALLAGFPITERHSHGFYVESYAWGFKYNLVDAAYFPSPKLDLKFVNDLDYPVMLVFKVDSDGIYQYHEIEVRTSSLAKKRTVEIGSWNIYNKTSEKKYIGSFTRTVKDNLGNTILTDIFKSTYR